MGKLMTPKTEEIFLRHHNDKVAAISDQFHIAAQRVGATREDLLVAVATLAASHSEAPDGYTQNEWLEAFTQIYTSAVFIKKSQGL